MNINPITSQKVARECLRKPNSNLVYYRHSKCASSLYYSYLKKLGWIDTNTQKINWESDTVFSHIRDPLVKHRKGIVEYFFHNRNFTHLVNDIINTKLVEVVANIAYLDEYIRSVR